MEKMKTYAAARPKGALGVCSVAVVSLIKDLVKKLNEEYR